ncbi:MAG: MMPL family transporter [Verrucomicrobiae bacterium]|nr:MMPL family transporter [Verrucomicrobiae bacterium]
MTPGAPLPYSSARRGFHRIWTHLILREIRHPWAALAILAVLCGTLLWQAGKLPKRLRGGLISLPGSESELVLRAVETDFSRAVAFPTILVQEGLGDVPELEHNWQKALAALDAKPFIKQVIDMHLGRKIVATITVNARSFNEAQQVIATMHAAGLPPGVEVTDLSVSAEGRVIATAETDVRSFKEGESRRRELNASLERMHLPEETVVDLRVQREPRRNFAMVELDARSYQEAEALTSQIQSALDALGLPEGNRIRVTGLSALFHDLNQEATAALRKAEWIGIPICFLVLIWVFGSPVAALLPILVAVVAVAAGASIMTKVGKVMEISMFVPSVLTMIGLGVGVDYMLILLARFRECAVRRLAAEDATLRAAAAADPSTGRPAPRGSSVDEAILEAMHLASPTLLGSGITVAVGFSALAFTPVTFFRAMGIAGISIILCALLCIFVLAPPLFKATHRWIVSRKPEAPRPPFWKKWTHLVVEHPKLCLTSGIALMAFIAFPVIWIEPASLNPESLPAHLESRKGYNLCKNGFGAGWLMPAVLVVERPAAMEEHAYLVREHAFLRKLRGISGVFDAIGGSELAVAESEGFRIEIPNNFFFSRSGRRHLILAMYDGNPLSVEGRRWIRELRDVARESWPSSEGFTCRVGGVVAATLDLDHAVERYLVRTAIFCLATTFVCFALIYRSFLIPLQAIGMNLLSVLGAYGFLTQWFQLGTGSVLLPAHVSGSLGMSSVVILLLFCALFGISMDYQVFLLSRIHEEWRRSHNNKLAVRHGIELTGRVVTGAAVVMIAIFLSFAFVSVLETRQFGTGMAAAIAFDSTVIRLLVFPSLLLLVGNANWWWPFGRKRSRTGR